MTATIYVPLLVSGPIATAASYAAVIAFGCFLIVIQADRISRWHRRAHPLVVRFTLALLLAVALAAVGVGAVYLPACTPDDGSWYCWLAKWGLL